VLVTEPVTVVDLVPASLVWRILRRYAHAQPGAGSQLANSGNGTAGRDAACTVGQKLARCPLVERVVFLEAAADWIQRQAGYRDRRAAGEHARNEDPRTIRWAAHWAWNADKCWSDAVKIQMTQRFREQFALLVIEFSACWVDDPAFRAWVDDKA
jgi:hypothetical protein